VTGDRIKRSKAAKLSGKWRPPLSRERDQRDYGGRRRRRKLAGPAASHGDNHGDRKGTVEAHARVDTGHDGEGDRLGDRGQRDDDARQKITLDVDGQS
jgi:hypothetical protein